MTTDVRLFYHIYEENRTTNIYTSKHTM